MLLQQQTPPTALKRLFSRMKPSFLLQLSKKNIWEKLESVSDDLGLKIAVFLGGNYRTDSETESFAYNCTVALFGDKADAMFIYLDFEGHSSSYDYICTINKADRYFSEAKRDKVLDAMYKYLPASGDPIYSENVSKALIQGLDRVSTQYRNAASQSSVTSKSSSQTTSEKEKKFLDMLKKIPLSVYVTIGIIILVLIVISKISRFVRGFSSRSSSYYDNDSYHGYSGSNYGRHSYNRRPHRSTYNRRPSRSRPSRSSSRSSGSSSSGRSGSGRHR